VHRIGRTGRAGLPGEAISLVAPQDHDAMAAIERLIKKRIERVLIPNFGPSGPTVATMMGDQPSRKPQRQPAKRPVDPIFSKPYEPSSSPAPAANQETPQHPRRKRPQVAALLGGLKKAS
jgi:ATP-dependent RNA helicase RhlE